MFEVLNTFAEGVLKTNPFRNLDVHHEEVNMLLSFVQRQLLGNDGHQHSSAGNTLKPKKVQKNHLVLVSLQTLS